MFKEARDIAKKMNAEERKKRNRKVFLYGLLVEQSIKNRIKTEEEIIQRLDKILTKKSDREFLGLPPLNE